MNALGFLNVLSNESDLFIGARPNLLTLRMHLIWSCFPVNGDNIGSG